MEQRSHTQSQGLRQGNRSYTQRPKGDVAIGTVGNRPDVYDDEEYDDVWPSRMPTSVRRYSGDVRTESGRTSADVQPVLQQNSRTSNAGRRASSIPPRRTATQMDLPTVPAARRQPVDPDVVSPRSSGKLVARREGFHFHWLVFVGLAMIVMMVGWMLLTMLLNWWQVWQDDLHYGRPRTSQYDFVVGHGDSQTNPSHFIALNLRRHVEILECPAGDCSRARILIGPVLVGQGQDLAAVTLSSKDVNGDGKPDIVINVQDSHFVFINDGGTFRSARSSDNIQI